MEEEKIGFVAMTQDSFLEATLNKNSWKVTQTVTQRRKLDDESDWEQESVTMTAISRNIDVAMAQVFLSVEGYLITRNHDLFSEPESQLVEPADGSVAH